MVTMVMGECGVGGSGEEKRLGERRGTTNSHILPYAEVLYNECTEECGKVEGKEMNKGDTLGTRAKKECTNTRHSAR